ncbi:MAG: PhzF family isomerase [Candidatus Eisenbacteria bacterium]|uniref:PhzF family isomerase n=1 Tax=Eiseniibacteriota bacterium TaxID=2212470 RepID=A0A956LXQ4_UNCEI|nr:PhzF family isomerase [Candidatus Eisenbacteria bacterium]
MKRVRVYQVDSFTTTPFSGNPAGVVPNADGLSEAQMKGLARELNNSETAFMLAPDGPDHELRVRFFTPTTEVPSCGHATIAAHYVRAVEKGLASGTVVHKIGAGVLPVEIRRTDAGLWIGMVQGAVELGTPFEGEIRREILQTLGLAADTVDERCPVQIVSTGHSKVLVGIRSTETLHTMSPDSSGLAALSRRIGCNGYFVFVLTPQEDVLAHGRMFAPAIGIAEDPVTGNANGPLGAYLVAHGLAKPTGNHLSFRARQGEAMGRPGTVEVDVDIEDGRPHRVRVGGHAVIIFQTEVEI